MTDKTTRLTDPVVGQHATYIGPEHAMQITGVIYEIDEKYIWIRDASGRERGCRPFYVRLIPDD